MPRPPEMTFPLRSRFVAALGFATLLAAMGTFGCDRSPDDLREWRASDHRGSSGGFQAQAAPRSGSEAPPTEADKPLVDVLWRAQCALCHGAGGRGDGPQGALLRATNLTLPEWQQATTDEQIADAIVNGKGRMPKFEGLSEDVVSELVAHIRRMRIPGE